jgi:outer membrane protein assembly factor BamB
MRAHIAVCLLVLLTAGCGATFSQRAFSNLFRDNNQEDLSAVLARQPRGTVQQRPVNSTGQPSVIATTYALKRGTARSILGIDPQTGRERFRIAAEPASRPFIAGPVFLVGVDRDVAAYSVTTGQEEWRWETNGMQYLGAAYDNGVVYMTAAVPGGARIARIAAFNAESGSKLWEQLVD